MRQTYPPTNNNQKMENKTTITKKVKQLSRTQQGVSLTKEDREILQVEENDLVEVSKHE